MNKIICVFFVFLFSSLAGAYSVNDSPTTGLSQDTAYQLKQGELNVFFWGWTTYGITDRFSLGTNFWLDMGSYPNLYAKFNVLPEGERHPAVSLGASNYLSPVHNIGAYDFSLYVSKQVGNLWLYIAPKYVGMNLGYIANYPLGGSVTAGLISPLSDQFRLLLEASYDNLEFNVSQYRGGGALEMDLNPVRARLGYYSKFYPLNSRQDLLYFDIYFRHKF
jgi:hypothetical protein